MVSSDHVFITRVNVGKKESVRRRSQGFFQQLCENAPGQNWEKMIYLTSKLEEINNIEHNKGSKNSYILKIKLF